MRSNPAAARFRTALVALAALLGALAAAPGPARAETVEVTVGHNRLEPAEVTLQKGDTLVFHNVDAMPGGHTVVSDTGRLSSPPLEKGARWSHTFDAAGTFTFHIKEHPGPTTTVVVE